MCSIQIAIYAFINPFLLLTNGLSAFKSFYSPEFKHTDFRVFLACSDMKTFVSLDHFTRQGTIFSS